MSRNPTDAQSLISFGTFIGRMPVTMAMRMAKMHKQERDHKIESNVMCQSDRCNGRG